MLTGNLHPTDQDLLRAADGELPTGRAAQVRAHLAACWGCRARMAEMEGTIADFTRTHRQSLDSALPPIDGPRALLRARLCELRARSGTASWWRFFRPPSIARAGAYICVAFLMAALLFQRSKPHQSASAVIPFERGAVPDRSLTPGATRKVGVSDVCSMAHEQVDLEVPATLRQKVLHEYGIVNARANDYEIDFLITPGLGGTEDIHNLWPESYNSPMWNARVKDALEENLHQMVCTGELDLSTAQHDIATDWIAAYKKYFHTNRPLSVRSGLNHEGSRVALQPLGSYLSTAIATALPPPRQRAAMPRCTSRRIIS